MHIAILSPSDKTFISKFLPNIDPSTLPDGYTGAPFIGTIIDELLSTNHRVTAITTTKSQNGDYEIKKYKNENFTWIVIPSRPHSFRWNGKKAGRMIDFFSMEQKLMVNSIKLVCPDIVHAHWSYEFAGAAVKSGFPNLVTVHDNGIQVLRYFKNTYRFLRLLMSEWILRKVRYSSTVSPYMISYVHSRCKSVKIIPNPVIIHLSLAEVNMIIKKRLATCDAPKIMMIMNGWDGRKNGKVGLHAFNLIKKDMPKATLHLYGHGTEKYGLAYKDCKKFSTEGFFFHGPVSHDMLLKEMSNAHILLHTALEESFGVVLIEAMSQGIPAIGGLKSGAVPWVIDNRELLVNVSEPLVIKEKIINLLINQESYQKTALKCYHNTVSRFSAEAVVQEYVNNYKDILKKW